MASTLPNMRLYFDFLQQNHKFPNDNLLHLSTRNRTFCNNAKSMAGGEASLQRTVQQMIDTMERIVEHPLVYSYNSPCIVAGPCSSAKQERHLRASVASYRNRPSPQKINLISCEPMVHISDIKLIRTDTTLDLSQKAEKGMLCTM
ncbi:hypothetical protein D0Y65_022279 [Glycine soja]|uniref:Uncharacterized protein n=1 Tax=Glycine soja TaxID=3848 RepID=A0A445JMW2_GLYSO|nr:hypothetical protein D0Y65_022279 [Glycine soja]